MISRWGGCRIPTNQLQSSSAPRDEFARFAARALRTPPPLPEEIDDGENRAAAWALIVAGVLTAGVTAYVFCQLPMADGRPLVQPSLRWSMILFRAVEYVALTAAAGAAGLWVLWRVLAAKPPFGPFLLSRHALAGWMFLPGIVLLQRGQSQWMLLIVALATVAMSVNLRRVFPSIEPEQEDAGWHERGELQTLYGLPSGGSRPLYAFFIAACAQGSLLFACAGVLTLAGILLAVCVGPLTWRLSSVEAITGRRSLVGIAVLALFITALAQLPWMESAAHSAGAGRVGSLRRPPVAPALAEKHDSGYVSVILWPPPKKPAEIASPAPRGSWLGAGVMARPLVIPFDGAYWYFEAPRNEPGVLAHLAHGRPTDAGINLRSMDGDMLLMEAHQTLDTAIDPGCCSEIDVAITNADTQPGEINLGVRFTDSTSPWKTSLFLGVREIVSSEPEHIPLNHMPAEEVLRFAIAQPAALRQFDEITVLFLPGPEHSQRGAKVAIRSFTLIPR